MSQIYREGELVWAKMRGHPAWPAKVSHSTLAQNALVLMRVLQVVRPPKGQLRPPGKLWIFFYGTHEQYATVITPFCEICNLLYPQCMDDDN